MSFLDLLHLSLRNLREAKLRATLTTMGVIVGVAVIVTMISFGLGLQRNLVTRFKELDLFNEVTVFGRSLSSLASSNIGQGNNQAARRNERGPQPDQAASRTLDDAAIEEIMKIAGVASVEPNISFTAYVRSNGRSHRQRIGGAMAPNASQRFKEFAAGAMISGSDADEIIVNEDFLSEYGYEKAADAIGKTVDLLAPSGKSLDEVPNFFGIPLTEDVTNDTEDSSTDALVARSFRIAGVLKKGETGGARFRMIPADLYIPLPAAKAWTAEHRDDLSQVALELARASGALGENEGVGFATATLRVSDPAVLADVRKRLTEFGFGSFSIVDELDEIRKVFLIVNAALGLLGSISLLVASFGIANTMIMSILERTREIGIMKAIGAEDREIKFIFFIEAAVIGLTGGVVGALAAWGIDSLANRLAYEFILKPEGSDYVDFFSLPPYLWLGAILFAMIVSIVAALHPASRAARIDPVKALRHD